MPAIDPAILTCQLDPPLQALITAAPLMPLDDSGLDRPTVEALQVWLKGQPAVSEACLAGLWLLAGDLERSHSLSQSIETSDGSYWHGIMHRREGDYFNAKYWMRRTSGHPVTDRLRMSCDLYHDALAFVDYVEKAVRREAALRDAARQVQWVEWQLLFSHSAPA